MVNIKQMKHLKINWNGTGTGNRIKGPDGRKASQGLDLACTLLSIGIVEKYKNTFLDS